jgi:hypothetical protein
MALRAQTTGVLEGLVRDPAGLPVPNSAIGIVEVATGAARASLTDEGGRFLVAGLAPGTYRAGVTAVGFRPSERTGIVLSAGRTVRVDFSLQLGEVQEKVTVAAEGAMVGTSASDWGGTVNRRQLDALPLNGRDVFDLAGQHPGVIVANHAEGAMFNGMGMQISVNGNRPNQNSFRMDGVYLNDASASAPASAAGRLLGVEGIEELRLIANPFSAEYGKAASAVLTAVSRSGANQLHGSAYHFLRNSALDAKNFFDAPGDPIPALRRNQFGGLISGPVVRNRVFFLANFEGVRESSARTRRAVTLNQSARRGILPGVQVAVPAAVQPYLNLYPLPNGRDFGDGTAEFISLGTTTNNESYGVARGDIVFSDRLRTSVRFTGDGAENGSPDLFLAWKLAKFSRFLFVNSETHYVQSARTLHSVRYGYSHVRNNEDGTAPDIPSSLSFVPGRPIGQIQATGLTDYTDRTVGALPRFHILDDTQASYQGLHLRGAHTLRFGAGYDRLGFQQRGDFNANGRYVFSSVQNLLRGITRSGDLMLPESDTFRTWRQNQYYFFVQDDVRIRPNLDLTFGVRYEGYTPPSEKDNKIATLADPLRDTELRIGGPLFKNPSARNFGPRAAVAWSPRGGGRTVLRAGAGAFFDLLTSREVTIAGMRVPPFFNRVLPTAPPFPNLLDAARASTPDRSMDGIAYNLQQPYVLQFRFSVEQQLDPNTAIEVGYAGSRGIHLIGQYGDYNISRPQVLADGRFFFTQGGPLRNPALGRIGLRTSDFDSNYHGLVVQLRHRMRRGMAVQASYTWAKAIDNSSSNVNTEFDNSDRNPFPQKLSLQRGPADFDVRHILNLNAEWRMPWRGTRWTRHVVGGWELNGLAQAQTGFPFNPRVGFDRARLQSSFGDLDQRPSLAAGAQGIILGDPARYFDPLAFELPDAGYYGNLGRNALTGPGLFSMSAGLQKLIFQLDRQQLRLRIEAFNATNHPSFDNPSAMALFASTGGRIGSAGQITATSVPARQMQISLRWSF